MELYQQICAEKNHEVFFMLRECIIKWAKNVFPECFVSKT
jgi:hypothetical protein